MLEYISNHLPSIMTGLTMAAFGVTVYEARDGFFLSGGKFRGKHEALLIFLGVLSTGSLLTPVVNDFWQDSLPSIPPGQILGTVLILGMIGVNKNAEWNYFDVKSALVYLLGGLLLYRPELMYTLT
jgi:hypothetical protein